MVFPCCICDNNIDGICRKDIRNTPVEELQSCPVADAAVPFEKKDMGMWVIVQPDGRLSYYNEKEQSIVAKDMSFDEVVQMRVDRYLMPYGPTREDTRRQIIFCPLRWSDIIK